MRGYKPYNEIKNTQPTRATCFHPTGDCFVVGSNNRTMSICRYPTKAEINSFTVDDLPTSPDVYFSFFQTHKGSIYCASFDNAGQLLATGSNDQTVRVIKYNPETHQPEDCEYKLQMHSGTVRDISFTKDNQSALLLSAGAGDFEIYVTDCQTMKLVKTFKGHSSTVMSLHSWDSGNKLFVSGSLDKTIKLWDLRCDQAVSTWSAPTTPMNTNSESCEFCPINVVRVDSTGQLLVSGHKNGSCMFYDLRCRRVIQLFQPHTAEIRSLNFSPKNYYLLTSSYDHKVKLFDIQGDLTNKLTSVDVAELGDRVVQTAWHPTDYNFVTTCADGTATLWTIPIDFSSEAENSVD